MILLLHNRYRHPGGEERAVEDFAWLVREHLGEEVQVLEHDSAQQTRLSAARGLLRGGLVADEVARRVQRVERDAGVVVHAHNVHPMFGWRSLAAAKQAGARIVMHLHNYRLVCAVGICFTQGSDCTRCHSRNTLPGVRLRCRGGLAEAAVYGSTLALWQRRTIEAVDAFIAPSRFLVDRLEGMGVSLGQSVSVIPPVQREFASESRADQGEFVLVAARLSAEKGVADAIAACRELALPLVIAGDGPELGDLRVRAVGADVRFVGRVSSQELADLRERAAVAVVPSRCVENAPLAAVEAMASGVPVVASRTGGTPELVGDDGLFTAGDVGELVQRLRVMWRSKEAGERALLRVRELCGPEVIAEALSEVYGRSGRKQSPKKCSNLNPPQERRYLPQGCRFLQPYNSK